MTTKIAALADHLGCEVEDLLHKDGTFEHLGDEYLVLTDEEADTQVAERIEQDLWAFNAAFILNFLRVNDARVEKAFQKLQGELCEDANDLIKALLGDRLPEFVKRAVSADGRGHFLATYDNEEVEADGFYIYRTY